VGLFIHCLFFSSRLSKDWNAPSHIPKKYRRPDVADSTSARAVLRTLAVGRASHTAQAHATAAALAQLQTSKFK
jgi:hypothetical protein